jgi:hypothetical protein
LYISFGGVRLVGQFLGVVERPLVPAAAAAARLPTAASGLPAVSAAAAAAVSTSMLSREQLLDGDDSRNQEGDFRRDQSFPRQEEQSGDGHRHHSRHLGRHPHHHPPHHPFHLLATTCNIALESNNFSFWEFLPSSSASFGSVTSIVLEPTNFDTLSRRRVVSAASLASEALGRVFSSCSSERVASGTTSLERVTMTPSARLKWSMRLNRSKKVMAFFLRHGENPSALLQSS